jgi:hypothetical protein
VLLSEVLPADSNRAAAAKPEARLSEVMNISALPKAIQVSGVGAEILIHHAATS